MRPIHHLVAGFALALAAAASGQTQNALYSHSATATLTGGVPDWDYLRLDQDSGRLFIARHEDGLTVYDINLRRVIGKVPGGVGANGPLTLTQFNRGYVAMTDGSALIFNLKTLATIARVKLDPEGGEMNGSVYDPATGRVIVATGRRPKTSTWYLFDAASGKLLSHRDFDATKMDDPVPDGRGAIYAPVRDQNVVLRLKSSDLSEEQRYALGDCRQPAAVEYREDVDRLLVACRGDKPMFLAIDPKSRRILASIPIGHGVDGMVIDEKRHRVITSNGADANLSVIGFDGADRYKLLGTVGTQPMARTMQIDRKTGRLFLVTADYTLPAGGANDEEVTEPYFHPGTFRVLIYTPR